MSNPAQQDEFLILLDQHKKILHKIAGSYGRTAADRQDLVQEMVVQLWRSFGNYDDRYRFSTWMYRVALNVAISFHRSEARRSRHIVPAEDSILESAAEAPIPANEDVRLLYEAMARLDELDRALLLLHLDGNTYDTIAEILGISETNVGTKLSRLKQRLRRDLSRTD